MFRALRDPSGAHLMQFRDVLCQRSLNASASILFMPVVANDRDLYGAVKNNRMSYLPVNGRSKSDERERQLIFEPSASGTKCDNGLA